MSPSNSPEFDNEDFGWGDQEKGGFFSSLKRQWAEYKRHKQIVAEERRSLQENEREMRGQAPASKQFEVASNSDQREAGGMVSRSTEQAGESVSVWQRMRQEREIRKQILEETKAADRTFDRPPVAPQGSRPSDFGIADSKTLAPDQSGPPRPGVKEIVQQLKQKLIRSRLPQWSLAILPAVVILASAIVPTLTDYQDNYARMALKLRPLVPQLVADKKWAETDIAIRRILDSAAARTDELFAYYETLVGLGKPSQAWNFLTAYESKIPVEERGPFELRFAEKILAQKNGSQMMVNQAAIKLNEALKYRLTPADETKVRQSLARILTASGDLQGAYRLLEPIQSRQVSIASEVLWLKWNLSNGAISSDVQVEAKKLLGDLDQGITKTEKPKDADIACRTRLLMLLNRENEARGWVATLPGITNDEKTNWSREVDQLALALEIKKTPLNEEQVWLKLLPMIEADPDNMLWTRIATTLWSSPKTSKNADAFQWVQNRIDSGKASITFMRQAAMAAHMNNRWELVTPIYQKLIKLDPTDTSSLNNLAGIYYKFPPYQYDEALKLIDKTLELAPDNLGFLETKGQILARMGKLEEARVALEKSLPLFPNEWNLHNTLAQIYELQGQKARAQVHRERMNSLKKPSNAPLVDAIQPKTASLN